MSLPLVTLSVILGLLLAEARLSRRHESWLRSRGAIAPAGDVYVLMAVLYPAVFLVMGLEGAWRAAVRPDSPDARSLYVSGLLLFAASKGLKYWAISALRERWSFRVLVLPGVPLVTTGPYRYIAHPNYVAVVGELAGAAMMMNAWFTGPTALLVFGATMWARVRFENKALHSARQGVSNP